MTPLVVIPTKVGIQGSFTFPGCPFPTFARTSFTGMTEYGMAPSCTVTRVTRLVVYLLCLENISSLTLFVPAKSTQETRGCQFGGLFGTVPTGTIMSFFFLIFSG